MEDKKEFKLILTMEGYEIEGDPSFQDAFNQVLNFLLVFLRGAAELNPTNLNQITDMANDGFSEILTRLNPDWDAHPDLTVDAIRAAEDYLIELRYAELDETQRAAARESVEAYFDNKRKEILNEREAE